MTIPDRAQIVIVGGGIIGCSIAYHLARRDTTDVVVLEQGELTGGTTWHAAGLVTQLKGSYSLTKLAEYSARLFEDLEAETGQATGYRTPGSILVASDAERWQEQLRSMSMARTVGIEMNQIGLDEAQELCPLLNIEDLLGAIHIPKDGQTSPVDTTMALAKGARAKGVRIIEGVSVTSLVKSGDKISAVETEQGRIEAETVVLASGMWTRHLADTVGVRVPLQACEHFYIVTEPISEVTPNMPTIRDPASHTYFKQETGKIMAGFFEPRGKVWNLDGIPRDFKFGTLDEDWDHIGPVFEKSIHRMPRLGEVGLQLFFNGPEAFTPDGVYYLGESSEVDGCFIASGFNSVGIQSAGGVGLVIADWIIDGHPPRDLSAVDIRRTFSFQNEPAYLAERIPESLGLLYSMQWPFRQYESARGQRVSALHDRFAEAGAVFGETAGWERPNWFATKGEQPFYEYSWGKQNWHEATGRECQAVRHRVGLFDQTSFANFSVSGPQAISLLNHMSTNEIDVEIGKVVYTQWLNDRGGIEADLTITRRGQAKFLVVTGAAAANRDWHWLRRSARGHDVVIKDMSSELATLGLMGPNSRNVLAKLTETNLSKEAFPFATAQDLEIGGIDVLAIRITYVGELGWELYCSPDRSVELHDLLVSAGVDQGLTHSGYHAMESLRVECGYRHWGHDISDEDTPIEAGLGFTCAYDKIGGFRGREACLAQSRNPVRPKRLIQFKLHDPDRLLYHDEPIIRNGEVVGRTTSGMFSYEEGCSLAMGYLNNPEGVTKEWLDTGHFEIEVASELIPVTPSIRSFYDPKNLRVKT